MCSSAEDNTSGIRLLWSKNPKWVMNVTNKARDSQAEPLIQITLQCGMCATQMRCVRDRRMSKNNKNEVNQSKQIFFFFFFLNRKSLSKDLTRQTWWLNPGGWKRDKLNTKYVICATRSLSVETKQKTVSSSGSLELLSSFNDCRLKEKTIYLTHESSRKRSYF